MKHTNIKKRVIAGILTAVTIISAGTAAAVPASAASASNSAIAGKVIQSVAVTGLKDVITLATKNSSVASILGDMGLSAFDSLLGGPNPNQKVLDSISELSGKIDTYHNEELKAIFDANDKITDLQYHVTMQNVYQKLDSAKNDYKIILGDLDAVKFGLDKNKSEGEELASDGFITENTYKLYDSVLFSDSEVRQDTLKSDLDTLKTYFCGESKELDNKSAYTVIIDNDKTVCERQTFNYDLSVYNASSMTNSAKLVQGAGAELTTDYAAYFSYLQAKYQFERYKARGNDTVLCSLDKEYEKKLNDLAADMTKVQSCYDSADAYFYDHIAAEVIFSSGETYYYTSAPKAWSYATVTANDGQAGTVYVTLFKDWGTGSNALEGLPVPRNSHPAFAITCNDVSPAYCATNDKASAIYLDLHGHDLKSSYYTSTIQPSKSDPSKQTLTVHNPVVVTSNAYVRVSDSVGTGHVCGKTLAERHACRYTIWNYSDSEEIEIYNKTS